MRTLTLRLPLPPGVNNQYVTAGKRRVLSAEAKAFRRAVAAILRPMLVSGSLSDEWLATLRDQPFAVDLVFYFETPYKRDLDGGLKLALDAVCDTLGLDDRYIVALTLEKRIDPLHPRLELELGPVPDWRFDQEYVVVD
ncbi:MAG: RusA family crossover junction endodeoxyribonuclease [Chloroflexi bacterium]|nr:MAG: RusA family crossover junction endodeoxyribonuclease [Chloroflexota bacterium]